MWRRQFFFRLLVVGLVAGWLILLVFTPSPKVSLPVQEWGSERGKQDAERDLRNGLLILKTASGPPDGPVKKGNYRLLMEKRCGVKFDFIAGDLFKPGQHEYMLAYNELVCKELNRRFGKEFLENLRKEAYGRDAEDERRNPKSTQS